MKIIAPLLTKTKDIFDLLLNNILYFFYWIIFSGGLSIKPNTTLSRRKRWCRMKYCSRISSRGWLLLTAMQLFTKKLYLVTEWKHIVISFAMKRSRNKYFMNAPDPGLKTSTNQYWYSLMKIWSSLYNTSEQSSFSHSWKLPSPHLYIYKEWFSKFSQEFGRVQIFLINRKGLGK